MHPQRLPPSRLAGSCSLVITFAVIDWTAIATFVLAAVTIWLAVIGGKSLRKTDRALQQTQEEIKLSRTEVEQVHRPVVVPLNEESTPTARPHMAVQFRMGVPIKNIGPGPALNLRVEVTPRDSAGNLSPAWGDRRHSAVSVALGVDAATVVAVDVPNLSNLPSFSLWLHYEGVAGKCQTTSATYLYASDTRRGHYTDVKIEPVAPS